MYLVPGFFGFANLGEFFYFQHLAELIPELFRRRQKRCELVRVRSHPTASIRERARQLLWTIGRTAVGESGPIHLVGHSTGGLDARLLVSPGVSLGEGLDAGSLATRVRSVISAATPHHGTPLASLFTGLQGQRLLWLLSLGTLYVLRFGALPLSSVLRLGAMASRLGSVFGQREGMLDQLFQDLLADFRPERRKSVQEFFHQVSGDQALIVQLTPDTMDVFNASATDNPQVAYGSLVTRAPRPGLRTRWNAGFNSHAQITHTVYALLHRQVGRMPKRYLPEPQPEQAASLRSAYGELPGPRANDGIVPTRSQPWGRVIAAVEADHLDLIGHFDDRSNRPPHVDWLATGSRFDREGFEGAWDRAVGFMLDAA